MKKVKLDDINKINTPFEVPDGYFDQLEKQIQDRVSEPISSKRSFNPQWVMPPALLVVVLISAVIVINNDNEPTSIELLAQVSDDEILEYLEYNNISEYDILTLTDEPNDILPDDVNYFDQIEIEDDDLDDLILQMGLENELM